MLYDCLKKINSCSIFSSCVIDFTRERNDTREGGAMFPLRKGFKGKGQMIPLYKKGGIYFISVIILFVFIGLLTTIKPAYRFSSQIISEWTSNIDSSTFLYLLSMENRAFQQAYPVEKSLPKLSTTFFQVATNVKANDPRSLLGRELPGFSTFGNQIIVAGEGTNYMNLTIESSQPLEDVLEEREAVSDESSEIVEREKQTESPTTDGKEVVFIYSSHNRESFLPHLPDITDPNQAHHGEVNITKVGERLAESLDVSGIGATVDETDIMNVLNEKGWGYGRSYEASREVATEAIATNKDIQYIFDLHRDSARKDVTTKEIDGESYAKVLFVVGAEYASYEKNLALATELHARIEEKYPGLSRAVITKEKPGNNGVYNQDLLENALLIEFGGVDNTLEELYRTADAIADVFSEFYWEAEKVDGKP